MLLRVVCLSLLLISTKAVIWGREGGFVNEARIKSPNSTLNYISRNSVASLCFSALIN